MPNPPGFGSWKNAPGNKKKTWVQVQRLSKQVYDFDPDPADWVTVYKLRVTLSPMRAREQVAGQKIEADATHLVTMRYMPGITSGWRLRKIEDKPEAEWRVFHIDGVTDYKDERRELFLACTEQARQDNFEFVNPEESVWDWYNDDVHIWSDDTVAIWSP